jgi:hypothetical protein
MLHFISPRFYLFGAVLLVMATWVSAQPEGQKNPPASQNSSADEQPVAKRGNPAPEAPKVIMTPERQAAAMKFAELHHPELFQLLQGLKQGRRPQYQQAVRQLYNDSERLARMKERVPSRYEFLLAEWQLDSRLRLLVARMTMSAGDPELEAQLRELLKKRSETRLALLQLDRERQAARLAKLDDQIQELESDQDAAIEKALSQIQRSLGVKRTPKKQPAPDEDAPAQAKPERKGN